MTATSPKWLGRSVSASPTEAALTLVARDIPWTSRGPQQRCCGPFYLADVDSSAIASPSVELCETTKVSRMCDRLYISFTVTVVARPHATVSWEKRDRFVPPIP